MGTVQGRQGDWQSVAVFEVLPSSFIRHPLENVLEASSEAEFIEKPAGHRLARSLVISSQSGKSCQQLPLNRYVYNNPNQRKGGYQLEWD